MSILNVEHVMHAFGDKVVFRDLSFRLLAGEHVGLVGTNGAGKSTLLRILTGELLPDRGRIQWMSGVQLGHLLEQHIDLQPGDTVRDSLRGAFAELFAAEAEMLRVAESMATADEEQLERLFQQFSQLQEALEQGEFYAYPGTILLVSHDPSFYQGWATKVWDVEAWVRGEDRERA